eukprot:2859490-Alexandrium_andersonii.AAC.1
MPLLGAAKLKPEYQGYQRLQVAIDFGVFRLRGPGRSSERPRCGAQRGLRYWKCLTWPLTGGASRIAAKSSWAPSRRSAAAAGSRPKWR